MIAVVDYGMGNLKSVTNAFGKLGTQIVVTRDREAIRRASAVVLPGVGAFGKCIENLKAFDLFDFLKDEIGAGKRYLGICLGLQILLESSEESEGVAGMGLVRGRVVRFRTELKVPHMGWNSVEIVKRSNIFSGIETGNYFYFVHSYYPEPEEEVAATKTEYGIRFTSSIEKENIFACQYHPEKSQEIGLTLLRNFVALCE
jgi:imidazole glycerol-phosphate synthase subunit HisH